jgi:hypothetical protein
VSVLNRTEARPFTGRVVSSAELLTERRLRRASRHREIMAVIDPVWADPDDPTSSIRAAPATVQAAAQWLTRHLQPGEVVAPTPDGRLRLRLRRADGAARPVRLQEMGYHAIEAFDSLGSRPAQDAVIDLGVGWAPITAKQDAVQAEWNAARAAADSLRQRDLQPRQLGAHLNERTPRITRWSAGHQIVLATLGSIIVPFLGLVGLSLVGIDLSTPLYWVLVGSLSITSLGIWAECSRALDPPALPPAPEHSPGATAVIAAYLPNEADTIIETVHAFLAQDYAPGLQIVLAYNTPVDLPVQAELAALETLHPSLVVLQVHDSTSKAQNVNAALRVATGEFVGIFDADHHPMPGSFARAWRWLADGADVVQGHCIIRNGESSVLAKLVAVEFAQIYAVSHPGRAALHGFGIFGGSNGYWRASTLERVRLRGSYLTEDIEASMRVLAAGGRIVNDPGLISRELAPRTFSALWKQRMRWAQGWFQVSVRHLGPILRSPELGIRQKAGAAYLLGWREVYPWVSIMAWPLFGFLAWRDGGIDLNSPLFALITLFVTAAGPVQTAVAYRLAPPELREHPWWFVGAVFANIFFYAEMKNLVARVAQLKQLRGEHQWVVTPRTAASTGGSHSEADAIEAQEVVA